MLVGQENLLLPQRTQVWLPAPMGAHNQQKLHSLASNIIFWSSEAPDIHKVHRYACWKNIQTHKINNLKETYLYGETKDTGVPIYSGQRREKIDNEPPLGPSSRFIRKKTTVKLDK